MVGGEKCQFLILTDSCSIHLHSLQKLQSKDTFLISSWIIFVAICFRLHHHCNESQRYFFVYFRPFKQTFQFLQQTYVEKCASNIQCWDLNNIRPTQCDQIGRFLKLMVMNFPSKVAQIYFETWAIYKNHSLIKTYFLATFMENWAIFILTSGYTGCLILIDRKGLNRGN